MSSALLQKHKRLLIFPVLSILGVLVAICAFNLYILKFEDLSDWFYIFDEEILLKEEQHVYVGLFILYLCEYLVIHFFSVALAASVMRMFRGGKISVWYGLYIAVCRFPQIMAWAFLSALFEILLSLLEKINDRIASVIVWLLGEAWYSLSFFVIPVLVEDGLGPLEACHRSANMLRRRWGESSVGPFFLAYLALFSIFGIAGFLFGMDWLSNRYNLGFESLEYWVVGGVFFVLACGISSAMNSIYVCLLYAYASEYDLPDEIDRSQLANVFR